MQASQIHPCYRVVVRVVVHAVRASVVAAVGGEVALYWTGLKNRGATEPKNREAKGAFVKGATGRKRGEKGKGERRTGMKVAKEGRARRKKTQQSSPIRTNLTHRASLVCRPLQCWPARSGDAARKEKKREALLSRNQH